MMKKILLILPIFIFAGVSDFLGTYITPKSKDGNQGIVELFEKDNKVYGVIIAYTDMDKIKTPIGTYLLEDLVFKDNKLQEGYILNPENDKKYHCFVWINEDNKSISLRGTVDKLGLFGITQVWSRF